jgi:tetratricopeptide (TPR) repeat protein
MLVLWGCSTAPRHAPAPPAAVAPAMETEVPNREALAGQLLEKHELAAALVQWKILRTIEPKNTQYRNQVRALQKMINEEAERHLAAGLTNLRLGAYDTARLSFLRVLALDPKQREALAYLREIDEQQARAQPDNGMTDPAYSKSNGRSGPRSRKGGGQG